MVHLVLPCIKSFFIMINYNFVTPAFVQRSESSSEVAEVPSTPKKLLGSLLEGGKSETGRLEEELMSTRLREVEGLAELKELRLKVMELETQVGLQTAVDVYQQLLLFTNSC